MAQRKDQKSAYGLVLTMFAKGTGKGELLTKRWVVGLYEGFGPRGGYSSDGKYAEVGTLSLRGAVAGAAGTALESNVVGTLFVHESENMPPPATEEVPE